MVLDEETARETLERLRRMARVTHAASPRLVVVRPTATASAAALRGVDGVSAVTGGELPPALIDRLRSDERLFAAAWASRMREGEPERRGEGLAWDAPGFVPPDPPPQEP